jgi:hypothetical protein
MAKKTRSKPPQAGNKITEAGALMLVARALERMADAMEIMASPPEAEPRDEPEPAEPEQPSASQ